MALKISSLNHRLRAKTSATIDDLHETERRWFAVRTSSRHEKRAVKELQGKGVEAYIPLREKQFNYASKKGSREIPLLTGYVFVNVKRSEEDLVRFAHYVSCFVKIGQIRRRVTEEEMTLLRKLSTDRTLDWETVEEAFDFSEGTPVEIIRGPLAGVRGKYISKKNKKTFVIALGSLGACLSTCEIDPRFLVALSGSLPPEEARDEDDEGQTNQW
jgi:transcription antitermination factor NusG